MVGFIGPRGKSGGVFDKGGCAGEQVRGCYNDKRCCAFAGRSDHEDLNMGGMVGWFGVFTFFCSVR
jgi:hypothetical protein